MNGILGDPNNRQEETDGLLQVGEEEVVDQDDILVVPDVAFVISSPEDQSKGDES